MLLLCGEFQLKLGEVLPLEEALVALKPLHKLASPQQGLLKHQQLWTTMTK
jgi:hypothetical protein